MQSEPIIGAQPPTYSSRLINQSPFFYGWVIMLVGALGLVMTSPAQTYAISIFIEHFIQDLGLSRTMVSTLYSAASLVAGFTLPFIGRQIDQRGSRKMMVIITAVFGLGCIFMGLAQNAVMLGIGFLALRIFGQGGLSLVSTNVINQWWVRRRGLAMGLAGLVMSLLGLAAFPNLINWLIPIFGWQVAYMIQGLMLLLLLLPLGLIFLRDRPEAYGLFPDGSQPTDEGDAASAQKPIEENWTVSEATRTPAFWIVAIGIASMALAATGLFFHMVSIFEDNGLSATIAATVFCADCGHDSHCYFEQWNSDRSDPDPIPAGDCVVVSGYFFGDGALSLERRAGLFIRRRPGRDLWPGSNRKRRRLGQLLWAASSGQHYGCNHDDYGHWRFTRADAVWHWAGYFGQLQYGPVNLSLVSFSAERRSAVCKQTEKANLHIKKEPYQKVYVRE